jgi:hypothetical protein
MRTECYEVALPYSEAELHAIFALARTEDVDAGGRYDARSAAINIWSHSWIHEATQHDSAPIGTLYFHWGDNNQLWLIECDEGFSCDDLLHELAILEQKALGHLKHGRAGDGVD